MRRIVRELNQCTANGEVYYLTDEEYAQATSYGMKYDTVKRVKVSAPVSKLVEVGEIAEVE